MTSAKPKGAARATMAGSPRTTAASNPIPVRTAYATTFGVAAGWLTGRRQLARHRVEALENEVLGSTAAQPQVGQECQPVGETSHSERFDVVWQYEVSPLESGAGPCGQQQSERAAGARPDLHTGERSCRPDHVDQIPTYGLAQLDALHRLAQGQDRAGVRD